MANNPPVSTTAPVFFMVGLAIGIVIGSIATSSQANSDAVAHNAAHYDSKTGKFTWNDEI